MIVKHLEIRNIDANYYAQCTCFAPELSLNVTAYDQRPEESKPSGRCILPISPNYIIYLSFLRPAVLYKVFKM